MPTLDPASRRRWGLGRSPGAVAAVRISHALAEPFDDHMTDAREEKDKQGRPTGWKKLRTLADERGNLPSRYAIIRTAGARLVSIIDLEDHEVVWEDLTVEEALMLLEEDTHDVQS